MADNSPLFRINDQAHNLNTLLGSFLVSTRSRRNQGFESEAKVNGSESGWSFLNLVAQFNLYRSYFIIGSSIAEMGKKKLSKAIFWVRYFLAHLANFIVFEHKPFGTLVRYLLITVIKRWRIGANLVYN